MALQTLNPSDLTEVSIPLGINANQGEQIQFSIAESTLPNSVNVYLDDVLMQTSTLLNNQSYSIVPSSNISGTGRFFLRTTVEALSIGASEFEDLKVYYLKDFSALFIEGKIANLTKVDIYDLQGRVVLTMPLDSDVFENRINLSSFKTGVYIAKVRSETQQKICKIIIH
ncbi:T9SS type A sorting domain-containing protein [Winogradskyella eckloniae]|uniref:T9SS type A sorting domain-containing protein n=1 Tax=Winogradskyella eckloniae TaxID=1089306 RepID=UPI0015652A50|nr:T9SS type A sorting domain-containing protein [Winogradskyella eckloniae]NRD20720.1 T9SS type A sorting domain-containing protein [Winogradskyella eckloniae]